MIPGHPVENHWSLRSLPKPLRPTTIGNHERSLAPSPAFDVALRHALDRGLPLASSSFCPGRNRTGPSRVITVLRSVLPIIVICAIVFWFFRRVQGKHVERYRQHMDRMEQALERIATALEKKFQLPFRLADPGFSDLSLCLRDSVLASAKFDRTPSMS